MKLRALLLALVVASAALALDVPPPPTQWFTDKAGLLDPAQAEPLNRKLADFEQQSGAQFIIYTFPSLEGESIEDFTIRSVERWKVGQKKYDNGIVLFVFVKERKVRIEVGYGLEGTITDAFASRVIREFIAPHFQRGDWAGGLNAGADAIIARIRTGEEPVPPARRTGPGQETATSPGPLIIVFLIVLFLSILPALFGRRRGCGGCLWPIWFMPTGGTTFGGRGGGWGGGGFSGGGGSFGGGGATGGW